ncbi:MAG: glycosyltransferase, partial [Firmicutes bacterium]|nr:glycosyltransferase [Bacillota bacterium]
AQFVREVFTGVYSSDMGLWSTDCASVLRHRRLIGGLGLRLFYNIVPEFASDLDAKRPIEMIARSVVFSSLADALLVSGPMASAEVDLEAEGFGIVFLEAAACGVPAVAGRSGGSHEAVEDGVTGRVVPPRDVDAVRAAVAGLVEDGDLRARMGAAARRRAVEGHSYDRLVEPLLALARGAPAGTLPA